MRKDGTHDAVRHGCHLACRARVLHVFLLLPLSTTRIASRLSGGVSPTKNGRNGTLRYATAPNWDSTALFHETQIQLSGVEFHFCPSCRLWSENSRFDSETSPVRLERGLATSVDYRRIIASGLHFGGKTTGQRSKQPEILVWNKCRRLVVNRL